MELFFILVLLSFITPLGIKTYQRVMPEIQYRIRERKTLGEVRRSQLALQTEEKAHKAKLAKSNAEHILELKSFDDSIKAIEGPAIRNMIERRVIEATDTYMPTDRDYWMNEMHLLKKDYTHISKLCEGNEVTETDVALLRGIVDRMDIVNANLTRLDDEERLKKRRQQAAEEKKRKLEEDKLKGPRELLDFLEVVNDPDSTAVRQMKALKVFLGDDIKEIPDTNYGRYTLEQLLDMAEKKTARLSELPQFDELMGAEALHRVTNSDNPERLMELWGVRENFNKWVSYVD